MQEKIISFETAKLAKEKGFLDKENQTSHYNLSTGKIEKVVVIAPIMNRSEESIKFLFSDLCVKAPTQALLQKWIREVHNIEVIVFPKFRGDESKWYAYECLDMTKNDLESLKGLCRGIFELYPNHEDTLEAGLIEALKLIK